MKAEQLMKAQHADAAGLAPDVAPLRRPRLAFLGLGWIGRMRLEAIAAAAPAQIVVLADPSSEALDAAIGLVPQAVCESDLGALLAHEPDGVVIATPSARHAEQAVRALENGVAVFTQKPLARTAAEARRVLAAARAADLPVGVDYSYRYLAGVAQMREAIRGGEIGDVFAVELRFHNAYGPDKPWFRDLEQAGGGCLTDLGTHLLDLALWCLGEPKVESLHSRLFAAGIRLMPPLTQVEDYAALDIDLDGGAHLSVSCSWDLHAGCDVIIEARFFGTRGAYSLRNHGGSYFDFVLERMTGTRSETLASYPDDWGGRALAHWVERLARGDGFDDSEALERVPELVDRAYGRLTEAS